MGSRKYKKYHKKNYDKKYNSINNAEYAFDELIKNTNSQYILISYNNTGIINQIIWKIF